MKKKPALISKKGMKNPRTILFKYCFEIREHDSLLP